MRRASSVLLSLLPLFALACNGQSSAAPPDDDGGTGDGGPTTFLYTPKGCSYSFEPQASLGFKNLALDDTGAVSATNGVPQRVRLGLGGGVAKGKPGYADPTTTAAFTWETAEANHAAKVRFGTSASAMTSTQSGYAWTVPASIGPATNLHEVHVCGLTPGTTYYYQVGGGPSGSEVWSATQSFTTLPTSGTIKIGIFGDARDNDTVWQIVHQRMKELAVDIMLVPGDVVDLGADEGQYQNWLDSIWKDPKNPGQFLTLGQQLIVPIDGNHENDSVQSFANWAIPSDSQHPHPETYASLDVGSVHFVLIDDLYVSQIVGKSVPTEAADQLTWLNADLTAADADRTAHPFIVALSHRGLYSTSLHSADGDVIATRGALAPLYDKYKVDLAFNGHDHEYERSYPLHANTTDPTKAPTVGMGMPWTQYIINAGAGADPYGLQGSVQPYSAKQQYFCGKATACAQYPYIGLYSVLTATSSSLTMDAYGIVPGATTYMSDTKIDTVTVNPQ
ncbi:MAG TPA: metallophosphoesterase family protein [Polyangiaceae bacterium]|nr:metallophosphoesterase family protein [Polyangiaceae bacterium]